MFEIKNQPSYYVAFFTTKYSSMAEVKANAPEALTAHISRSKELSKKGRLLMAGAFREEPNQPVKTMGIFYSRKDAEEYVDGDPFVINGMISEWHITEWGNILKE